MRLYQVKARGRRPQTRELPNCESARTDAPLQFPFLSLNGLLTGCQVKTYKHVSCFFIFCPAVILNDTKSLWKKRNCLKIVYKNYKRSWTWTEPAHFYHRHHRSPSGRKPMAVTHLRNPWISDERLQSQRPSRCTPPHGFHLLLFFLVRFTFQHQHVASDILSNQQSKMLFIPP